MPRALDHLVLTVKDLTTSRERFEALGFSVNATGYHPFGTANCCIFFENDTYLEPLAVYDMAKAAKALSDSNPFVMMDQAYRNTFGDQGLSGIALKTQDAVADQKAFATGGAEDRTMLSFEREAKHPDGTSDLLKVQGAYCAKSDFPGCSFFTVEWLGDPSAVRRIRSAPEHPNGAIGVTDAYFMEGEGDGAVDFMGLAFDATATPESYGSKFALPGFNVHTFSEVHNLPETLAGFGAGDNTRFHAFAFRVAVGDPERVAYNLTHNRIPFEKHGEDVAVPAAEGQGAAIVFGT
ncbi:MAG: VOC family protein [Pseudomonadota bacterium]